MSVTSITSEDKSDGCFDLKAANLHLDQDVAIGCNRAYRISSPNATASTITAQDDSGAALWLGEDANLVVARGGHRGSIVFRWERGVTLIVKRCDLTGVSPGQRLLQPDGTAAKVQLDPATCKLPPSPAAPVAPARPLP